MASQTRRRGKRAGARVQQRAAAAQFQSLPTPSDDPTEDTELLLMTYKQQAARGLGAREAVSGVEVRPLIQRVARLSSRNIARNYFDDEASDFSEALGLHSSWTANVLIASDYPRDSGMLHLVDGPSIDPTMYNMLMSVSGMNTYEKFNGIPKNEAFLKALPRLVTAIGRPTQSVCGAELFDGHSSWNPALRGEWAAGRIERCPDCERHAARFSASTETYPLDAMLPAAHSSLLLDNLAASAETELARQLVEGYDETSYCIELSRLFQNEYSKHLAELARERGDDWLWDLIGDHRILVCEEAQRHGVVEPVVNLLSAEILRSMFVDFINEFPFRDEARPLVVRLLVDQILEVIA